MGLGIRIDAEYPVFTADNITELARAVLMLVIWLPYLLFTKKVKAVLIRKF